MLLHKMASMHLIVMPSLYIALFSYSDVFQTIHDFTSGQPVATGSRMSSCSRYTQNKHQKSQELLWSRIYRHMVEMLW